MFGLGQTELLVILGVALLLFGGRKLPELGRGLGRGIRSFREGLKGIDAEGTSSNAIQKKEGETKDETEG